MEGHGLRAQGLDHVDDQLGILDTDRQARHVRRCADGVGIGIEAAGAGIVPAQAHQARLVEFRQEVRADLSVQDAPHVVRVLVEEGKLEDIELGDLIGELRQGHPGEVDAAEGHLLQHLGLGAEFSAVFDLDDDLAAGGLPDQLREAPGAQDRGVAIGLVFRIGQHIFRHRLRRSAGTAAEQHQRCEQDQNLSQGESPFLSV